ncbi:hypothetical protein EFM21_03520 [Leuconostoc falkenbergense]|uniref:hypothetical protein n=1 Tax=Leuconostoc falkenbergense TaxID=2766470 RepID=UPI0021AAA38A|nr:hypothetical protein [Leuconostoc falkenbergense]MCT4378226.1 hypothetical protein [Leuconostoc falkenbergense]MDV8951073.1 hypothetical protein [Leuconostoc falkenbergense]
MSASTHWPLPNQLKYPNAHFILLSAIQLGSQLYPNNATFAKLINYRMIAMIPGNHLGFNQFVTNTKYEFLDADRLAI